jgi:hypothetical protein
MNLYFLVEGRRTEKKVYRSWISHAFPHLQEVQSVALIQDNNYFILSGNGYPSYTARIPNALNDIVNHGKIDYFFICIDSEEFTIDEKREEILSILRKGPGFSATYVVIHMCCIESWFLGNRKLCKSIPEGEGLREFRQFYNVVTHDPELMGRPDSYETKASFHHDYLREEFKERGLSYSKNNPSCVTEPYYLRELIGRAEGTNHLQSFRYLISQWRELGAAI